MEQSVFIKSRLNDSIFILKPSEPKISLPIEASEISERIKLLSSSERPSSAQIKLCKNQLPINFFLTSDQYRKSLILNGGRFVSEQSGPFDIIDLEQYNSQAYRTLCVKRDTSRMKLKQQKYKVKTPQQLSFSNDCRNCQCCCCDQVCKQCLQCQTRPCYQFNRQKSYLYQKFQQNQSVQMRLRRQEKAAQREAKIQMGLQVSHSGLRKYNQEKYIKLLQNQRNKQARRRLQQFVKDKYRIIQSQNKRSMVTWSPPAKGWGVQNPSPKQLQYKSSKKINLLGQQEDNITFKQIKIKTQQQPPPPPCHVVNYQPTTADKIKKYSEDALAKLKVQKKKEQQQKEQRARRLKQLQKTAKSSLIKSKQVQFNPSQKQIDQAFKVQMREQKTKFSTKLK